MDSLVLVLDDDLSFESEIRPILQKYGMSVSFSSNPADFANQLKKSSPAACLIDMDILGPGTGLVMVKAIRKTQGSDIPLFVVSGPVNRQALAHSIEKGADDCFIKPLDPAIIASKLVRYIKSDQAEDSGLNLRYVPGGGSPGKFNFNVSLSEVDESGVKFLSEHLIAKGTLLEARGPFFDEIANSANPVSLTVVTNWVEPDRKTFGAFAEYATDDDRFFAAVRRWISSKEQ